MVQSRPASTARGCGPAASPASFSGAVPTQLDGNFGMNVVTSVEPLRPQARKLYGRRRPPARRLASRLGWFLWLPAGVGAVEAFMAGGLPRLLDFSGWLYLAGLQWAAFPGVDLRPVAADGPWRRGISGVRPPGAADGRGGDIRGPIRHVVDLGLGWSIEPAGLGALRAEKTRPVQAAAELAAPRMMRLAGQGTSAGMRDGDLGSA